jgi:molybdate transport system substrate-binding protein
MHHRLLVLALFFCTSLAQAGTISIAAAADLRFAMDEIIKHFQAEHPADRIEITYGSSGKFHTQIQQGAPYDLYFSADIELPRALAKAGFAVSPAIPYATGRIVLWSASLDASKLTMKSLADRNIRKVAIANPQHAPYGKRAEEALRAQGMWDEVRGKAVFGENIAQTAQFVQTGNADIGIIALSLAIHPAMAEKGSYYLIPEQLHTPLEQGFIITRQGADNALAKTFAAYMGDKGAREIMRRYGFALPGETAKK